MEEIIYKTRPRFFVLSFTLLGFVFFGLLSWLIWIGLNGKNNLLAWVLLGCFLLGSLICFYFFISIRTVSLTNRSVIFSYILLPFKQVYSFPDIKSVSQNSKTVEALIDETYAAANFNTTYLYIDLVTTFDLTTKKQIKLNSIGKLDYREFVSRYNKLKNGEGKIKEQNQSIALYVIDNVDGLMWIVLLFIVTTALAVGLLTR